MYQERTSYVIPIIIACLAVVIAFGFFISPGCASEVSGAEEALSGSANTTLVLDENFIIESDEETGSGFWAYQSANPSENNIDDGAYVSVDISNGFTLSAPGATSSISGNLKTGYAFQKGIGDSSSSVTTGVIYDAAGQIINVKVSYASKSGASYYYTVKPIDGETTTLYYYRLSTNPIPVTTSYSANGKQYYTFQPYMKIDDYYVGIEGMRVEGLGTFYYQASAGAVYYTSTWGNNIQQNLYVMEDEEKYYLWLFREDYGSSIIIEGKATTGVPSVTITNGGRYYTDNYFVALDKYDSFGVEYGYNVQLSAFTSDSTIVKQEYTFGERGSNPGGTDDPIIIPPSIIEIPEAVHSLITSPGELPSLQLPFDFTVPTLTLDLTSGYNTAFNSTWLGVNEAYNATKTGIDSFVSSFAPNLGGLFGDVVYTITSYVEAFRESCEELRNTYAVPFFNLMVRISGLVPSPVWIVFDIWLIYCAVRLVVHVFTCPLADVIRRSF